MRLIDADALKEIIMDMRNHAEPSPCLPHQTMLIPDRMVFDKIDAMPTISDVPVVHSRWKHGVCENCRFDWAEVSIFASVPNYCPNCGAKMDGKEKENG